MGDVDRVTHVAATLFGAPLPAGGTIGVSAPSGPYYNRSDIERPVEWWQERGFRVKLSRRRLGQGRLRGRYRRAAGRPTSTPCSPTPRST